jgi:hypothetical protein
MSAKNRPGNDGLDRRPSLVTSPTGNRVRQLRAALRAGASLIALGAVGAPGVARACSGADQTISVAATGPIFSTGGAITVLTSGIVTGTQGVAAYACQITTLTNNGTIAGNTGRRGSTIGTGVANGSTIKTLLNNGTISGGAGAVSAAGGVGIANSGTIATLSNSATISGGSSGANLIGGAGIVGAAGISNFGAGAPNKGMITILTNTGSIRGGNGGAAPAACPVARAVRAEQEF